MPPIEPGFAWVWDRETPAERARANLALCGREPFECQWTSGAGGTIDRAVSWAGLERWKLRSFDAGELQRMGEWLTATLQPLAIEPVVMLPETTYAEGAGWIGWVFWHPKEAWTHPHVEV
ncbi:MAG: hypothetical protein ACRD1K_20565 [Acidimicrobiales bacterium]